MVNFTTGTLAGDVFQGTNLILTIDTGSLDASGQFNGTLTAQFDNGAGFVALPLDSTDADVYFYGNDADFAIGSHQGNFTSGYAGANAFIGRFTSDKI